MDLTSKLYPDSRGPPGGWGEWIGVGVGFGVWGTICILFTFNVYLTALMESHPELQVNKHNPQNMWKV